ncbi:MAG: hypothetical protein AAFV90_26315 [Cyanobacteria bacterium J06634_5]
MRAELREIEIDTLRSLAMALSVLIYGSFGLSRLLGRSTEGAKLWSQYLTNWTF